MGGSDVRLEKELALSLETRMNTKRCPDCQKLLRAEASACHRCGHVFAEVSKRSLQQQHRRDTLDLRGRDPSNPDGRDKLGSYRRDKSTQFGRVRNTLDLRGRDKSAPTDGQQRTIPPASPHRAGHYAGLHPEDQPYQSTIFSAQQALAIQTAARAPVEADVEPLPSPSTNLSADDVPTYVMPRLVRERTPLPPVASRPRRRRKRVLPLVITLLCLLLLLAGSFTVYALMNRGSAANSLVLAAQPNLLRVGDSLILTGKGFGVGDPISFIHDGNHPLLNGNGKPLQARATDLGTFLVAITIPANWSVGQHSIYAIDLGRDQSQSAGTTVTVEQSSLAPPLLALAAPQANLGAAAPGVVSRQTITLINAGGRQVVWQASSDQPWLTLTPSSGTFSGRGIATVLVNRGALAPQPYRGHITFIQQGKTNRPLTLTVNMVVTPAPPASLTVSAVSLSYLGTQTANPASQPLTLQNTSGQAIDWSSAVITGNGVNWLSLSPASGHLTAHSRETVTVSAQSQQMALGTYDGTIGFKGGMNPIVSVTMSVIAQGNLAASPPSLTFAAVGQNPSAQAITLQNSGGETVSWSVSAATVDGAHWLAASPASGSVPPGGSATVSISINAASLAPRAYQGTLTFSYNGASLQVPVSLTVSVPPAPAIGVNQSSLNFTTLLNTDPTAQSFTITNTGNAILHWATAENQNGASFAPLSPSSGSLNPAQAATVTVSPTVVGYNAGILSTTITITDSDSGSKVASQSVNVSVAIVDQAMISLSTTTMDFSQSSSDPSSEQLLAISNIGTEPLNWTAQSSAPWLSANMLSDTVAPNAVDEIDVECDATGLSPGTYSATLTISDSDLNTPVAPQTLTVTLIVN